MGISRCLLAGLIILLLPAAAAAQSERAMAVRERAAVIDEYRTLLSDENPSIRLAAFEAAMDEDDPLLRTMAMEAALGAEDERLQTTGLRHLLTMRDLLVVEVLTPEKPSDAEAAMATRWGAFHLEQLKVNPKNDEVTAQYWEGQLRRAGIELVGTHRYTGCRLALSIATPTLITGTLSCLDDKQRVTLPVRVNLS